jgi:hypothetical protein
MPGGAHEGNAFWRPRARRGAWGRRGGIGRDTRAISTSGIGRDTRAISCGGIGRDTRAISTFSHEGSPEHAHVGSAGGASHEGMPEGAHEGNAFWRP